LSYSWPIFKTDEAKKKQTKKTQLTAVLISTCLHLNVSLSGPDMVAIDMS